MDAKEAVPIGGDLQTQSNPILTQEEISALEQIPLGSLVHTPLHIAAFQVQDQASKVDKILEKCPGLALVLDQRRWSPLRLAVFRRHMGIVKALLKEAPEMCAVIDDDGYNPFHLAAIMGWKEGLAELIKVRPHVAFEVTSNGESILHLCVKHNNQDCLRWLLKIFTGDEFIIETFTTNPKFIIDAFTDHEFINAKDKAGNNILHQAVRSKKIEIIRLLIINPNMKVKMCGVINDDGYNPLHLAAIMGWKEGLTEMCGVIDQIQLHVALIGVTSNEEELVELSKDQRRHVAFEVTSNGESILHLCVKHNKEGCLKWLLDTYNNYEFINAKDNAGNNILHQAVRSKKIKIIKCIISRNKKVKVNINATNAMGLSPLDIILQQDKADHEDCEIMNELTLAGAERKFYANIDWLKKKRGSIMVVASLIATMAFAAGRNPPGGVWKDTQDGHQAGEAIFSYLGSFKWYQRLNNIAFLLSLSIILILISGLPLKNRESMWALQVIMWITITLLAFCYLHVIASVSPKHDRASMERTLIWSISSWSFVMLLVVLGNVVRLLMKWIQKIGNYLKLRHTNETRFGETS